MTDLVDLVSLVGLDREISGSGRGVPDRCTWKTTYRSRARSYYVRLREHTMGRKKGKRKTDGSTATIEASTRGAAPRRSSRSTGSTGTAGATSAPARPAPRYTSMVPVRFEPTMLDEVRARASADGRSVSAWIRRAVEAELRRAVDA